MKILHFFLPRIFKLILMYFLAAVVLSSVLAYLMPNSSFLPIFIMYLIFPMLSSVSPSITVSGNIHWLLMTPHKKSHLILINAAVNSIKTLLTLSLLGLYTTIVFWKEVKETWDDFFIPSPSGMPEQFLPSGFLLAALVLVAVLIVFHFGIFSFDQNKLQEARQYKTSAERNKHFAYIFGGLIGGSILIHYTGTLLDAVSGYVPFNVLGPFFLSLFITISILGTLETLKSYYSRKKLAFIGLIIFMITTVSLFTVSFHHLENSEVGLSTRISDMDNSGIYAKNYQDEITQELTQAKATVLREGDINVLFAKSGPTLKLVYQQWDQDCKSKSNYSCRLAFYAEALASKDATPTRLRLSCPNDIESCFLGYRKTKFNKAEQVYYRDNILKYCDAPYNSKLESCKKFISKTN